MSLENIWPPKAKTFYANMGIDICKYSDWEELNDDLWVTDRDSVFPEDAYQARVKHAHSNLLAIRAFIFNVLDYLSED